MRDFKEQRKKFEARGDCSNCGARPPIAGRKYCGSCRAIMLSWSAQNYAKNKKIIFDHFGSKCACCGEAEVAFLTLDHINNDGHIQRKNDPNGGVNFYRRVAKLVLAGNPPKDLQILCRNCNWGKHSNGGVCPHLSKYLELPGIG